MTATLRARRALFSIAAAGAVLAALPLAAPVLAQDKPLRVGVTAGASTPNNRIGEAVVRIFATRGVSLDSIRPPGQA